MVRLEMTDDPGAPGLSDPVPPWPIVTNATTSTTAAATVTVLATVIGLGRAGEIHADRSCADRSWTRCRASLADTGAAAPSIIDRRDSASSRSFIDCLLRGRGGA